MVKKIIRAPGKLPFSKAIVHNQKYTMELSGQVGLNSETGKLEEGIEAQTRRALENVKEVLQEVGWGLENLIKVRIFLADMKYYSIVNEIYSTYFKNDFPTRMALAVKGLPLGALIEIDCTASGDDIKE
ncbi:MAG: RidA family protein [Nanoarchaeota archaeon]|nr:RidA family protein [Nanoarchaeota archaeon]MBU1321859.1 RidA family protein [Nanoarchaeota archaeon]MBU1597204.1 RidA family protein [Nanoarchaeota archaeon]MBU2441903.1 RidA family protein [Nanoarchaeota archaeon]